ncbi:MAG: sugar phosphate isomerase/epimerase [Firmicutes bacterium]|nr:sugar phosphate isomerase/epimerase [Bacillota bacterium]
MKLGVFTVLFGDRPLPAMLDTIRAAGVACVELGTGGYPGDQVGRTTLLADSAKVQDLRRQVAEAGLSIAALSCHGNPLHPRADVRAQFEIAFQETLQLAEALEVPTVVTFSGCPGDSEHARYPNWVTCAWPPEYRELLEWQWTTQVIPYWQAQKDQLVARGVRVALEMHPGFVVYNPETLLRLRDAVGPVIGANLDPSHLFWQGIDPVEAIRALGSAIYHVHAKDTRLEEALIAVNGVLDPQSYGALLTRRWLFRTLGYGHDAGVWRNILSTLRMVGYDGVVSIEHEDALLSIEEGFSKAVDFLKPLLLSEEPATPWWT